MTPDTTQLATLLRRRLEVVADHAWRDRDPDAHLAALAEVSTSIDQWHKSHADQLPPRLRHFLEGASYDKALAWIES